MYIANSPIIHNGKEYARGVEVKGLSPDEAKRLLNLRVIASYGKADKEKEAVSEKEIDDTETGKEATDKSASETSQQQGAQQTKKGV